ncbi:Hypothetical_protein [Hexamita inflata]|uniref:Hypothetical_protein n=1 Tax=Hexamita inflata TaxID=28002 RepID=A0AA86N5Q1_9EUKA|nr:Hypothetical protein HINF_LOCUS1122 [Hexamita inflata]
MTDQKELSDSISQNSYIEYPDIVHSIEFLEKFTNALKIVLSKHKQINIDHSITKLELFRLFTHNNRDDKYTMQDQIGKILNHSGAQIHGYFEKVFQIYCFPVINLSPETKLRIRALIYDLRAAHFDAEFIKKECQKFVIQECGIQTCRLNVDQYVQFIIEKDKQRQQDHRSRSRETRGLRRK